MNDSVGYISPGTAITGMTDTAPSVIPEDDGISHSRACFTNAEGQRIPVVVVRPRRAASNRIAVEHLLNEYRMRDQLDGEWALRPLELQRQGDSVALLLENSAGVSLEQLLSEPLDTGRFLHIAVPIVVSVGHMHAAKIVHRDLKPAHLYVDEPGGRVRLTGFGIALGGQDRPEMAEHADVIAGTMAYMAPEQTGRMNWQIDARSDLYSIGVVFYRMLTGQLPFSATAPMEWIHSHTSRTPVAPHLRRRLVEPQLSAIVMKLLEKCPSERYQSAAGLERDLRRCMAEWSASATISRFELGVADLPERLSRPTKLYGRDQELARLTGAFSRAMLAGSTELVMISGYAGIGKSCLARELQTTAGAFHGTFASGKCDQYNSDVPYASVALALKSMIKSVFARGEDDVRRWRDAMLDALGQNGRLVTDFVPDLELLIGKQPDVADLPPQQAQARFQRVLRDLIQVFATLSPPLVLFIDDLQWADAATLDLIEHIAHHSDMRHLLLIGAYRHNAVDADHPLTRKISIAKAAGIAVHEIGLLPLSAKDIAPLLCDILHSTDKLVEPLARVVYSKTAGNPFFVVQFLHALAEENVLVIDPAAGRWSWNVQDVRSARYTDNVADLMAIRLNRLPPSCNDALRDLACLGSATTTCNLAIVRQTSEEALHGELQAAIRQQLVERVGNIYRFAHDRIHEAAYSLIPACSRAEIHLMAARRLLPYLAEGADEGLLFEIVGQFNRAGDELILVEERHEVAALNLRAGIRAKRSAAYDTALRYFSAGSALLSAIPTNAPAGIHFEFELEFAECEFLTGQLELAERRLASLPIQELDLIERGRVTVQRMDVYTALNQSDDAIAVALEYLRCVGIKSSAHPSDQDVHDEYAQLHRRAASLTIDDIVRLPAMVDPLALTTLEVLTRLLSAACFTDFNLNSLITYKAINLSLTSGNCDASCVAYGTLSRTAGPRFGDFDLGIRFSHAGYRIAERNAQHRFHASTSMVFAIFTKCWVEHVRASEDTLRYAFSAANKAGDLLYASYSLNCLNTVLLFAGDPLSTVHTEAEHGLAFARNAQHGLVVDIISTQIAFIDSLRGRTKKLGTFGSERFNEQAFESSLSHRHGLAIAECWYWTRKMQARYLAGDYDAAFESLLRAESLMWTSSMFLEEAEFHFYAALTLTATLEQMTPAARPRRLEQLARHQAKLNVLANHFPRNFDNRAALVDAEIARIESRILDAERLYEQAIDAARASDFPHQEAIASELAARFYQSRGFAIISDAYLRNARYGYMRWGALGKVRQLDDVYPHLGNDARGSSAHETTRSTAGEIDYWMLIDVSQRVSSEIVLENVVDTFMRAALTHSGADRAILILTADEGPAKIQAEATVQGEAVCIRQQSSPLDPERLPTATITYVMRTQEVLSIPDVSQDPICATDAYAVSHGVRSILCIPLVRRGTLVGTLYLENKLSTGVFAPARLTALGVLVSQVAITLENARLYQDLSDSEARIRRLVDANIIGIFIYALDGTILDANSAFLDLLGYSREELGHRQLNWRDITPPEWIEVDFQIHEPVLRTTGVLAPIEKEYFRKDGSRAPVLVGAAMFSPDGDQGVAFVLDLSESKRAEARARDSEIRFSEMQQELAHANRVSTVGQLTAMISHEVKQPIAAMSANADAALRWLSARPPNVDRAARALELIVRDTLRTGDIIDRIRDLVRKSPVQKEQVDVNDAILEVLFMTRRDAEKNGIGIETTLAAPSPIVTGDRVQLQQVVLNLVANAIEAMNAVNEGRRLLSITTSCSDDGMVDIKVKDSGPGMSAAHMERLFEPFFTTKDTGMGIGLSVAHSIVQAHDGHLRAIPDEPSGATFHITLPAALA
ncbi:histidine kinase [Burkholderia anthina]|uniref:trifunctional serine/threonine-protein kinase/ATP-binding protein/sensor histidine kinase n=1 Tax=Burkholderia anthina TaxID=179879 RepID=UPI00075C329F|nr:AAA family ATPase [Burkholderia anthina]KVM96615.1 histidine kinase [Burkholderia anthina]